MIEAVDSAAKPLGGSSSITRRPSVRMIRKPPAYVPSDSTAAALAAALVFLVMRLFGA